jgi:sulfite reductase (NADPH) flavoprotein alpha-component
MPHSDELSAHQPPSYSRTNPYLSKILERKILTLPPSTKAVYHVKLSIDPAMPYACGDSIAIHPENPDEDILPLTQWLERPEQAYHLLRKKNLQAVPLKLATWMLNLIDEALSEKLSALIASGEDFKSDDLYSFLTSFPPRRKIDPELLAAQLLPIAWRFYSIASRFEKMKDSLDCLVSCFSYPVKGRLVKGVGSSFLCEGASPATSIPLYIHPSKTFRLPDDATPIIMIGPGTGVAPFRAFIQERIARGHRANWLFFGERSSASDFYYKEEFLEAQKNGYLKLSLAFSRDQSEKIYVQHLMQHESVQFMEWVQQGAIIYVCGDASKMAKDVQASLELLFMQNLHLDAEGAKEHFKSLRTNKKIVFEVY